MNRKLKLNIVFGMGLLAGVAALSGCGPAPYSKTTTTTEQTTTTPPLVPPMTTTTTTTQQRP